jgi:hypothetical protein
MFSEDKRAENRSKGLFLPVLTTLEPLGPMTAGCWRKFCIALSFWNRYEWTFKN